MRPAAALLLAILALFAPRAAGQDITVLGDDYSLQFDEQEGEKLEDFINLAQKLLGRPIRYVPEQVGNVTIRIIGPQKIRQDRFYQYFQAILKAYGFLIIEYGPDGASFLSVQQLSPAGGGRGSPGAGAIASQAPVVALEDLDKYENDPATLITTSIPLKYVNARDQLTTLNNMFDNQIEQVRAVENANQLVITGFGTHVWGAHQLIKLIDLPPFKPTPIIHQRVLLHAAVDEIQDVVTELLNAARGLRAGQVQAAQQQGATIFDVEPRIIPEPRSNSLLISGDEEMVARIEEWVDVLDVEVEPRGNTHVYRLKNTNAKEVEEVLTRVLDQERLSTQQRAGAAQGGGVPGQGLDVQASAVADAASNSVIVTASERKYREMVNILREMDVRRPQVLIEAAIVETSQTLTDALTAGVAVLGTEDGGFVSNFGTPTGLDDTGTVDLLGELSPPATGGQMGLFSGGDVPIPLLIQALQTDVGNQVLSRPYLMTNDNQEASISTLEQTNYQTSTTTQTATNVTYQSVEAGIKLTISPSISAGNYLRLKVKIEVSNFGSPPAGLIGAPPDKTIREVETPVTLPDGHTAILGGLVNNISIDSLSKVPWLGDLPLIGWLFRSSRDETRERYLYVFITPHIIDTDFALLDELSEARRRDLERLGGDVRELSAGLASADGADRRVLGAGLQTAFELPAIALPSTGERVAPAPIPPTAPATPPAAEPAAPAAGFDEVFGLGQDPPPPPTPPDG
jgi:general secretion pathway protein D